MRGAGSPGSALSQRPLARRNHLIRVSHYYTRPPDDLIERDFSFTFPVRFKEAAQASTDRIAAE
jgi:hypothetical protein